MQVREGPAHNLPEDRPFFFLLVLTGSSHISSILGYSPSSSHLMALAQEYGILGPCSMPGVALSVVYKSGLLRDKGHTTYIMAEDLWAADGLLAVQG